MFVLLLASGQDSGRNSLFKAVTLVLRTDEQQGGFSLFAQFVQQSLDKNKVGNIVRNEGRNSSAVRSDLQCSQQGLCLLIC